jgi:hypothetical protein
LCPLLGHEINDLLREFLPAAIRVRVGFVRADSETGIEEEHAAVCPGGQEARVVGRWGEVRIIILETFVDVS